MKDQILKLKSEGKSYNQIVKIIGCSKGTISYHCGEGQKEKHNKRQQKRRSNPLVYKVDAFRNEKPLDNGRRKKMYCFAKSDTNFKKRINTNLVRLFTWQDVINKFGENTFCYLSGEKINLLKDEYAFDHIIPVSRGGNNSIDNLGITHKIANDIKRNLMNDEFFNWCKKILEFNGYDVTKISL